MKEPNEQAKILAFAIVEIRQLLSAYLGRENEGDLAVRQAAHLAYALHNQAEAVLDGKTFDVTDSLAEFQFTDRVLGAEFTERFSQILGLDF